MRYERSITHSILTTLAFYEYDTHRACAADPMDQRSGPNKKGK